MNFFATARKGSRVVEIRGKSMAEVRKCAAKFASEGWEITGPLKSFAGPDVILGFRQRNTHGARTPAGGKA